ncbi:MAG: ABC transporter ATP-binding protein [Clostridia bacterium]|nr:ABC transporter ATP-binding protein [Clostridia bacterium]
MKVELQNLTKIFPSRNKKSNEEVVAVSDFTFTIPDGKLVGLLGPSGCGKSTTLYMISGLQKPTPGKIFFGDEDVTELSPENRGIGLVFQNYALYPHMTVKQNILFPLQNLKGADRMSKPEMLERAYEAAKLVQIDGLMDRKPSELSGGQQQRVAIARALVKMPRVLLLDEPLSNLDARLRLQTREEIRRIQKETGITTIFVTHDQEEAMSISDIIVVMKLGVVQQVGKPQDIYDDPINLFVAKFLGTPPINVFHGYIKGGKLYVGGTETPITETVEVEETVETENGPVTEVKTVENIVGYKYDGGTAVLPADAAIEERGVYIGIRPEGFELKKRGALECKLSNVEVMGRDCSVVSTHEAAESPTVRSIIDSDSDIDREAETVRFALKPNKVFAFDKWTEERIYF